MMFVYQKLALTIGIGALIALLVYIKRNPESEFTTNLERFLGTDAGERYANSWWQIADRLLVAIAFLCIIFLMIWQASFTVPESDANAIESMFDLGFVTLSAYEVPAYLIIFWTFKPMFVSSAIVLLKFSGLSKKVRAIYD